MPGGGAATPRMTPRPPVLTRLLRFAFPPVRGEPGARPIELSRVMLPSHPTQICGEAVVFESLTGWEAKVVKGQQFSAESQAGRIEFAKIYNRSQIARTDATNQRT